ncbi:nucleotidyl transferase AbiEii/AbiGii toxin family protein [Novipirellula maiorica]|nr:nucleotidyl transferase AbiEii/AbiGii toxin family protein [Rhodopirellula maiorica]
MTRDMAASVRGRLMNQSKQSGRPFQELLTYFAMERFLFRLSQSPYADRFVLKGALMFAVWGAPQSRATRDIDLLAHAENSVDAMTEIMRSVCEQSVAEDGIVFLPETVKGIVIKEDSDYEGVRVTFVATIQNARVPMQIDIGFGDVIHPSATAIVYPGMLDFETPELSGYPRETVIAEKFEAMTQLGQLNSRMKDFYDILILSRQFDFDGKTLSTAIKMTFANARPRFKPSRSG